MFDSNGWHLHWSITHYSASTTGDQCCSLGQMWRQYSLSEDKCFLILNALLRSPTTVIINFVFLEERIKKEVHWLVPQAPRVALKFEMTISAPDRRCPVSKSQNKGVDSHKEEVAQEKTLLNSSLGHLNCFSWSFYTVLEGLLTHERRNQVWCVACPVKDLILNLTQFPGFWHILPLSPLLWY